MKLPSDASAETGRAIRVRVTSTPDRNEHNFDFMAKPPFIFDDYSIADRGGSSNSVIIKIADIFFFKGGFVFLNFCAVRG